MTISYWVSHKHEHHDGPGSLTRAKISRERDGINSMRDAIERSKFVKMAEKKRGCTRPKYGENPYLP